MDPAVPTLRLDPQLRAAVLAVPPPQPDPDSLAIAALRTPLKGTVWKHASCKVYVKKKCSIPDLLK